jgi:hypothetical protein
LTEDPEKVFAGGMVPGDRPALKEDVENTGEASEAEHESEP